MARQKTVRKKRSRNRVVAILDGDDSGGSYESENSDHSFAKEKTKRLNDLFDSFSSDDEEAMRKKRPVDSPKLTEEVRTSSQDSPTSGCYRNIYTQPHPPTMSKSPAISAKGLPRFDDNDSLTTLAHSAALSNANNEQRAAKSLPNTTPNPVDRTRAHVTPTPKSVRAAPQCSMPSSSIERLETALQNDFEEKSVSSLKRSHDIDSFPLSKLPGSSSQEFGVSEDAIKLSKSKVSTKDISSKNKSKSKLQKSSGSSNSVNAAMNYSITINVDAEDPPRDEEQRDFALGLSPQQDNPRDSAVADFDKKHMNGNSFALEVAPMERTSQTQSDLTELSPHFSAVSQKDAPEAHLSSPVPYSTSRKRKAATTNEAALVATDAKPIARESLEADASSLSSGSTKKTSVATKSLPLDSSDSNAAAPSAPKKKKTFQDEVLHLMLTSCKPYTLKTLAQATRTTEIALHHLMLSLVDKNHVIKKEFPAGKAGKTKDLYWANQDAIEKGTLTAQASAQEIRIAEQEMADLARQEAALRHELTLLLQQPSSQETLTKIYHEEQEVAELQNSVRDAKLRIESAEKAFATAKKSTKRAGHERCPRRMVLRINQMRTEWKTRKEKCMDFVDNIADAMEKKPKDVVKLLDIETDEMVGIKMPPKHVVEPM